MYIYIYIYISNITTQISRVGGWAARRACIITRMFISTLKLQNGEPVKSCVSSAAQQTPREQKNTYLEREREREEAHGSPFTYA